MHAPPLPARTLPTTSYVDVGPSTSAAAVYSCLRVRRGAGMAPEARSRGMAAARVPGSHQGASRPRRLAQILLREAKQLPQQHHHQRRRQPAAATAVVRAAAAAAVSRTTGTVANVVNTNVVIANAVTALRQHGRLVACCRSRVCAVAAPRRCRPPTGGDARRVSSSAPTPPQPSPLPPSPPPPRSRPLPTLTTSADRSVDLPPLCCGTVAAFRSDQRLWLLPAVAAFG